MKAGVARIVLRNHRSELPRAHAAVRSWLDLRDADSHLQFDADLVVEEIITNLIKYAWSDDGEHRIVLELDDDGGHLVLRFEDDGRPFDPRWASEPKFESTMEQRQPGNLGLHLVRQVADRIEYHTEHGVNRLTIRLRVPLGAQKDP